VEEDRFDRPSSDKSSSLLGRALSFNIQEMSLITFLKILNLLCFYGFGLGCLFSKKIKAEFDRYGLPQYRTLTGVLQLAGGTGQLVGFYFELLTLASSLGLALLMLLGVGVRIKIHDPLFAIIPAFSFMCLNFFIFTMSLHDLIERS